MPTRRLPTQHQWREVDWDGAAEMGFELPRVDFVTAEDMTRERDRETKREHSQTHGGDG